MNKPNDPILPQIEARITALLPVTEAKKTIAAVAGSGFDCIDNTDLISAYRPAEALLGGGGKRWRPRLMALCSRLTGREVSDTVLQLAVLPELVHNGTLMVDDIEDGAVLRRGSPCAHIRYGVDTAINSGNLLYFLPTVLIDNADLTDSQKLTLYRIYAFYMRRVHFGQALDIEWHKTDKIPEEAAYLQMCRLKTGSLAAMAAECGLFLGGGTPEQQKIIGTVAENIGIVFQIADDIINLRTGNKGKNRGDDIVEKKKSLPVILYCRRYDPAALMNLMRIAAENGYERAKNEVMQAVEMLLNSDADKEAEAVAESLRRDTLNLLRTSFPETDARRQIEEMVACFL
ncbi:MAG: polyprenyl synthetase family protein [Spirochaetia bacterium]|nr:polyprenyl synthetase family protein [Spirochaetia bacterium]